MTDRALLLDIGVLLPPRFPRMVEYARSIDVDPGALLTVLLGVRPYDPGTLPAPLPDPGSARRRCDRGEATWAQALEEIATDFPRLCGKPWDVAGYGRFLASGPGLAVRLDAARVVRDAARSGCNVVVIATGPAEFATGMPVLVPDGVRLVFTHELGVARPDPAIWAAAADAAGLTTGPESWCIVADTWESIDALHKTVSGSPDGATYWDGTANDSWVADIRDRLGLPAH